jgi:glycosyltransferase involved in cell wall biosynthesis
MRDVAFARGQPILASDLPLNQELQDRVSESLALFESENPEACAREIRRLLRDEQALENLRARSRLYAEKYSLSATAERHWALYESLMARDSGGGDGRRT